MATAQEHTVRCHDHYPDTIVRVSPSYAIPFDSIANYVTDNYWWGDSLQQRNKWDQLL